MDGGSTDCGCGTSRKPTPTGVASSPAHPSSEAVYRVLPWLRPPDVPSSTPSRSLREDVRVRARLVAPTRPGTAVVGTDGVLWIPGDEPTQDRVPDCGDLGTPTRVTAEALASWSRSFAAFWEALQEKPATDEHGSPPRGTAIPGGPPSRRTREAVVREDGPQVLFWSGRTR